MKWLRELRQRFIKWHYTRQIKKQCASYGTGLNVKGPSYVTKKTVLGDNVNFNGMGISGKGNVRIGNNFHSGRNCFMLTSYHNYDKGTAIPYDSTYIHKDIIIEDNVWLGQGVTILGGITIGEGAIIQAGSVVVKSIPKYALAGGHPAKVFKYRDIDHYESLKAQGSFH